MRNSNQAISENSGSGRKTAGARVMSALPRVLAGLALLSVVAVLLTVFVAHEPQTAMAQETHRKTCRQHRPDSQFEYACCWHKWN